MAQRILQPHEIESLDHVALARLRLPRHGDVFSARAARLRQLSGGNPIGPYLEAMAVLAAAQHEIAQTLAVPAPDPRDIELALAHGMPPLTAAGGQGHGAWRGALAGLLSRLDQAPALPPPARQALARLGTLPARELEDQVQALLAGRDDGIDAALAPFLMAALQVSWTHQAGQLREQDVPLLEVAGVCPVCGSLPVASIVRIGGRFQGLRYLHCGLCASEWHMVRVKCSHCESTEGIAYYTVDGAGEAVKAESCDHCHSYRKICYMEKDPQVEPLADDLATLTLDVLMGEAGYARASANPLLWQPGREAADGR
ncbi:formate dehydrogenase accessory protein FdhE [Cupriavidus malaysiensis]|uniref:Protein FdhE homolog n=1 Tax=Cupriavidus malaysiensis TaxID=367825 RepID=A0ABM6FDI1_9BURK|nr:formate dehydrogenase accessory protein FdhE [Cupriavidus malaysiensis]AOZ09860.1 formate dehydrogenase accessory protein FdhE [Cupriavidus malaysiensis]